MVGSSARTYSFRTSTFFLWDTDGGYVRTVSVLRDNPARVGADDVSSLSKVQRREKLLFHIKTKDYFGMLATALGFVEDKLSLPTEPPSGEVLLVRELRDDLRYLHDNYDICPKAKSRNRLG